MKVTKLFIVNILAVFVISAQAADEPKKPDINKSPAMVELNKKIYDASVEVALKQYARIKAEYLETRFQFAITAPHSKEETEAFNLKQHRYTEAFQDIIIHLQGRATMYDEGILADGL